MSFLLDANIQHCITRVIQSIKKKQWGHQLGHIRENEWSCVLEWYWFCFHNFVIVFWNSSDSDFIVNFIGYVQVDRYWYHKYNFNCILTGNFKQTLWTKKNIVIIYFNTVNIKIHLLYENKHNLHTNIL
jgi:hypothetical protein